MVDSEKDPWYTPPTFTPFEFDDSHLPGQQRRQAVRWLPSFNGARGEPTQNVQLGWRSADGAQVDVGTYANHAQGYPDSWARSSAVLILSGLHFANPGPPVRYTVKTTADVRKLAEQDDLWHEDELVVNETSTPAVTAKIKGFRLGYAHTEHTLVAFVAGGIGADVVRVRSLSAESQGYTVDPLSGHTLSEVDQEWQDFFRERPELRQL